MIGKVRAEKLQGAQNDGPVYGQALAAKLTKAISEDFQTRFPGARNIKVELTDTTREGMIMRYGHIYFTATAENNTKTATFTGALHVGFDSLQRADMSQLSRENVVFMPKSCSGVGIAGG